MDKWTRLLVVLATLLLLFAFVAVAVRLGLIIHHTLLLFALGALVAYALEPLVGWLHHRGVRRQGAVAIVFIGLVIVIGMGAWWLEGKISAQAHAIPLYEQKGMAFAGRIDLELAKHHIHYSLVQTIEHPPRNVQRQETEAAHQALPLLTKSATFIGESLVVILIALYFLIFSPEMRTKFNQMLPAELQTRADIWETDVSRILGGFVRGQLLIALIMGAAAGLGCLALGIGPWLLIGLFVTVAALIPVFGPYLGAIPAVIAALIGPTHFHNPVIAAVLVVIWFVIINEAGGKVLYPRLVGSALGLHEVLVLFVLFAGLEIDGIVGTLLAAPVAALAIVSIVHLYRYWQNIPDGLLSNTARRESKRQGQVSPSPKPAEPATHES
jgi:predicted PurR-regulated permease PerM